MAPERIPYESLTTQEAEGPQRPSDIISDVETLIRDDNLEEALKTPRYSYLHAFLETNNYWEWTSDVAMEPDENQHPTTQELLSVVDDLYSDDQRKQEERSMRKKLIFSAERIRRDLTEEVITDDFFVGKRCA